MRRPSLGLLLLAHLGAAHLGAGPARAQQADPAPIPADVEETVARALYDRGVELYRAGRYQEAHQLFAEAIARSPQGAVAPAARKMLSRAEMKIKSGGGPDDTRGTVDDVDETETMDPYGPHGADAPIDPYADADAGEGDDGLVDDEEEKTHEDLSRLRLRLEAQSARRNLVIYGGAFGLWNGIAVAAAADTEETSVLLVLGGASLGFAGGYLLTRDRVLTEGQANAIMSGATWGAIDGVFLAWAARDLRDAPDDPYDGWWTGTLVGGLLGLGGGIGYASFRPSPGDVAVVNSVSGYGVVSGLLLGGIMDPPYDGAYGMNAFLGSLAGMGAGLYAASELEVSRSRMAIVDLGAALGALSAWALVYPVVREDDGTNDDVQVTSLASLVTMTTGIALSWWWTRDFDARHRRRLARAEEALRDAPPALLVRSEQGTWHLGSPALRLAPASAERAVGIDLLSGSW